MLTMTRTVEFDAGHRLLNHEAKCRNIHGHRYVAELEIALLGELDIAGRVVDFGDVKKIFGGWIDEHFDHAFIANRLDPIVDWLVAHEMRHHVVDFEPSAENLAAYLLDVASNLLDVDGARRCCALTLHETPNGRATATR